MITPRRLAIAVAAALVIVVVVTDQVAVRLGAMAALLLTAFSYASWSASRRESTRHDRPADAPDDVRRAGPARVGEPADAVARFVLQTQHGPRERWHGQEPLWMAVSDTWVWLFHQTTDGDMGGVKSRFSRAGMHTRWTDDRLSLSSSWRAVMAGRSSNTN